MIHLYFNKLESDSPEESPELEPPGVVEENLFDKPVFFMVHTFNLLRHPRHPTIETISLPLIGFQSNALKALQCLKPGAIQKVTLTDAGMMYFQEINGKVRISTSREKEGIEIDKREVLVAFEQFAQDVRVFIETVTPSMRRHPQWSYWFPADATYRLDLGHTR